MKTNDGKTKSIHAPHAERKRASKVTDTSIKADRRSEYTTEVGDINNDRAEFVILRLHTTESLLVLLL